jgi:hypothetical protein
MINRRWRAPDRIHPARFILEALEPRCLLDGTIPTDIELQPGAISGELTSPDQFIRYKFHAQSDARYTFQASSLTGSYLSLQLFSSDGRTEIYPGDYSWNGSRVSISWLAPNTSDFCIQVKGAGAYQL